MSPFIAPWRLKFKDPVTERVFRHEHVNGLWSFYRMGGLIIAFCDLLIAGYLGYRYQSFEAMVPLLSSAGCALVFSFAATYMRSAKTLQFLPWMAGLMSAAMLFYAKYVFLRDGFESYSQRIERDFLVEIPVLYLVLRIRTVPATVVVLGYMTALWLLCNKILPINFFEPIHIYAQVITANVIGFSMCFAYEKMQRRAFLNRQDVVEERAKSEVLLANLLPPSIAERLKNEPGIIADVNANVTVLFADIVGFTRLTAQTSANELVSMLNDIFSRFDKITADHGAEKIKTIGDAYMAVAGAPTPTIYHADIMADLALTFLSAIESFNEEHGKQLAVRIGLASGPVVAGIIGTKRYSYDMWGETVNLASRLESASAPGQVHISAATHKALSNHYTCESRGTVQIKDIGSVPTFWLKGRNAISRKRA